MQNIQETQTPDDAPLLRIDQCRKEVFKDESSRPALRTFKSWKARGFFPFVKIGHSVYLNPVEVRKALEKRFTIKGKELV
jgi:hypothetical protein